MIKREEIDNLANLARLELDEAQKESLAKDLDRILDYVGELKEAKTSGAPEGHLVANVMREDGNPLPAGMHPDLVSVAPKNDGQFVCVKKIL